MKPTKKVNQNRFSFADISKIYTVRNLARIIGEPEKELIKLAAIAENFYQPFDQKQKNKIRHIDNPVKELKHVQERINERLLKKYPLPIEIYGGRKNFCIKDCAAVHLNQPVIIKLDLADCYPNISGAQIYSVFRKKLCYSEKVSKLLTKLCTYKNHLPQGGKHSNALLNILISPLCVELSRYCQKAGFQISFWVDDIAISGKQVEKYIPVFLWLINKHGFKINTKKIKILRANRPQEIVGCLVNKVIGIPKEKRLKYKTEILESINNKSKTGSVDGMLAHADFLNPKQAEELKKLVKKFPAIFPARQ